MSEFRRVIRHFRLRQDDGIDDLRRRRELLGVSARRVRPVPRARQPDAIRLSYFRAIRELLERARELVRLELLPLLDEILQRQDALHRDAVDVNALMDRIGERYFRGLDQRNLEALASQFAKRTVDHSSADFRRQVQAVMGVEPTIALRGLDKKVSAFVAENVALIKSVPSKYFDDVEKSVTAAASRGVRAPQLAREIQRRFKVSEASAKLIARDQIGKFYGRLAEERQTQLGVEKYTWRSMKDGRVRGNPSGKYPDADPSHWDREGEVFSWDDPPEGGHPGEEINCRCYAEPVIPRS